MKREMWEMPDNEIAALLDRAIMVLDELHIKLATNEDIVVITRHARDACKRKSPLWHTWDSKLHFAVQAVVNLEQRVAAQETIVQAFRNESNRRNPPFWTRYDLDRINRQR